MYFTEIEDESSGKYGKIIVDGRSFFYLKQQNTEVSRKKYIDTIINPKYNSADIYRKLNMVKMFKADIAKLEDLISSYIECIKESLYILKKEFNIPESVAFKAFKLKKLGIDPEEFSVFETSSSDSFD